METNGLTNIKTCFTINQNRTTEEFKSYEKLIEDNLFQAVEIFYPYDKTIEEQKIYEENVNNLKKYNIEFVLHLPFGPRSDLLNEEEYEAILQRMKDGIDFGKKFGVKKYTLHLGSFKNDKDDRKYSVVKCVETMKILCDYAYPSYIMIENMPGYNELGYSPDEIKNILINTDKPNAKFIIDFGHANVSDYSIKDYIYTLRNYLVHTHISDNDGTRDQHKPIGYGNINYKNVYTLMNEINYKELYCLEIIYHSSEDLREYQKKLIESIKN